MARNTSFTPYDEEMGGAYDEEAGDPGFLAYGSSPSMAEEDYPLSDDPMPLFLSSGAGKPRPRGFGTGGEVLQRRVTIWPKVFKAAIAAGSAAMIALGILTIGNPLALFADAKASLPDTAAEQSDATQTLIPPPAAASQLADAGPLMPVLPTAAGVPAAPRVTREDIALALRAAQQNQAQPDPPPLAATAPATAARRLDADELANLLKRAKSLIAVGDIAPARLLLERAADAQEASAALLLAQTYDPAVLGTPDLRSITPDPAMARDWYQKAARLGSLDARQRLAQMQN